MALVELERYFNSFEAGLVRSVLAAHGVDSFLFDHNISVAEGGIFAFPIRLMIAEEDLDEARRILAAEAGG